MLLTQESIDVINKKIRDLNKSKKDTEYKVEQMIRIKDEYRFQLNELLDDLFAYLDLTQSKINN